MLPENPLKTGIYKGWVRHRRKHPREHEFQYPLAMVMLDVDDLLGVFQKSPFWSLEKFNCISFRRKDYIQDADDLSLGIRSSVINKIKHETGQAFDGKVLLLTHPRYFGWVMNPVSFYFCYERDSLKYIVAEINNTPWDERHSYVLDATGEAVDHSNGRFDFEFDKDFHVSPFMPMDIKYHWRFSFNGKKLVVHMNLTREGEKVFDATMHGRQEPLSANNMRMLPIEYPFQTVLVGVRIYWHALLLWLKRVPFLTHPDKLSDSVKSGERS